VLLQACDKQELRGEASFDLAAQYGR